MAVGQEVVNAGNLGSEGLQDPESYDFWSNPPERLPAGRLDEEYRGIQVDVVNGNIIEPGDPLRSIVEWDGSLRLYESVSTDGEETTRVYYLETPEQTFLYENGVYETTPLEVNGWLSDVEPGSLLEEAERFSEIYDNESFTEVKELEEGQPDEAGTWLPDAGKAILSAGGLGLAGYAAVDNPESVRHMVDQLGHIGAGVSTVFLSELCFRHSGLEEKYGSDVKRAGMAATGLAAAAGIELLQGAGLVAGSMNEGYIWTLAGSAGAKGWDVVEERLLED